MYRKEIGKRINIARKDKGLTSETLAELCNINATYMRQIESGTKLPSLPVFISICQSLTISPSYLLMDALGPNEAQGIEALAKLWRDATPTQTKLVTTMLQSALYVLEE